MPIVLDDLFTPAEAGVLAEAATSLPFVGGEATAGAQARAVKKNEQAAPGPETRAVLDKVEQALSRNALFQATAYPRQFASLMVTRTSPGGAYGTHVDNALIGGARADLSFTLFLSDPASYEGGDLMISDRLEERAIRLPRGQALLYPTGALHRVAPVTAGTRLVVVGWVQSWVEDPRAREALFDLWRALQGAEGEQALLLSKTRSNLLRMWAR